MLRSCATPFKTLSLLPACCVEALLALILVTVCKATKSLNRAPVWPPSDIVRLSTATTHLARVVSRSQMGYVRANDDRSPQRTCQPRRPIPSRAPCVRRRVVLPPRNSLTALKRGSALEERAFMYSSYSMSTKRRRKIVSCPANVLLNNIYSLLCCCRSWLLGAICCSPMVSPPPTAGLDHSPPHVLGCAPRLASLSDAATLRTRSRISCSGTLSGSYSVALHFLVMIVLTSISAVLVQRTSLQQQISRASATASTIVNKKMDDVGVR